MAEAYGHDSRRLLHRYSRRPDRRRGSGPDQGIEKALQLDIT